MDLYDHPLELTGTDGYRARIGPGDWPIVGAAVTVFGPNDRTGPWSGSVEAIGRAKRLDMTYALESARSDL